MKRFCVGDRVAVNFEGRLREGEIFAIVRNPEGGGFDYLVESAEPVDEIGFEDWYSEDGMTRIGDAEK